MLHSLTIPQLVKIYNKLVIIFNNRADTKNPIQTRSSFRNKIEAVNSVKGLLNYTKENLYFLLHEVPDRRGRRGRRTRHYSHHFLRSEYLDLVEAEELQLRNLGSWDLHMDTKEGFLHCV